MFEPAAYHIFGFVMLSYLFNQIGSSIARVAAAHAIRNRQETSIWVDLLVVIFATFSVVFLLLAVNTAFKV